MAVIETKYDVGDVVWYATSINTTRQHPCPDCLGEKVWVARSPAGTDYEVACPRCTAGYISNRTLALKYLWYDPIVTRLTIGLVKANSDTWDGSAPKHEYMCLETGVGSGPVYKEADLFASEDAARDFAKLKTDLANADVEGWPAKQFADTAQFSDYQLNDAAVKSAESELRMFAYKVQDLLEDLKQAASVDEAVEMIERWRDG